MINIETCHFSELKEPDWRSTHTLKPDLKTLTDSLVTFGWLSPIVVQTSSGNIIDGFHRWGLAQSVQKILKRDSGQVPVVRVDCDALDARLLHVQMNRARGELVPKYLSLLVEDLLRSGKFEEKDLKSRLSMGVDELGLLLSPNLFKKHNIAEHKFSAAWVPIEGNGAPPPQIERPPNADH